MAKRTHRGIFDGLGTPVALMARALPFLVVLISASPAAWAGLPQKHPYQQVLRTHLASLTEADYDVKLRRVEYVANHLDSPEKVYRFWLLARRGSRFPHSRGLRVPSKHFTLKAIEDGGRINMMTGRGGWFEPVGLAWWINWNYPGNPYHDSKAARNRAFAAIAVDLMMLDQAHESGRYMRSDYLGGSMIRLAYAYWVVKQGLPQNVQAAYETGLKKMFVRLEKFKPRGSGGGDMEFFQLVGLWYAADALGGGTWLQRAVKRAHRVIDEVTSPTGYEKHGNAFDVSYQGIALGFLTWAALLYQDAKIDEALRKMLVLKSHLTLPEPGGPEFGPTHFNTGTAADAPHDQWASYGRDVAMAMIHQEATYTVWSAIANRNKRNRYGIISPKVMQEENRATVEGGLSKGLVRTLDDRPKPWKALHWVNLLPYAYSCYRPGFYEKMKKLQEQKSP